ncbi:MAG: putative cytokinetic ring protein SteA [Coriobacteriia bacterium]|nr:putative cytokinetic ring protein SteA [Coriobacteriia bacterium]
MAIAGQAQKGLKTKDLVKRLKSDDIAVIAHTDIDRVSAEGLVATGVRAVVNAYESISGRYPNVGPQILINAGITLLDAVGIQVFDDLQDGDAILVKDDAVYRDGAKIASGVVLDSEMVTSRLAAAELRMGIEMEQFVKNTASYLERQSVSLIYDPWVPTLKTEIRGKQVLVVARGYDYKDDLKTLIPYIRDVRPVLIGVDGGADALLKSGFKPDIILGDMDSVTDKALRCGAEIIAHAYDDGTCPSKERLDSLGIDAHIWPLSATSEDLGLLLAWEKKADLIVALGTHSNLVEYLDKGRSGMASSLLVRLKVGTKLVDAKGVSKLYRSTPPAWQIVVVVIAALLVMITTIMLSTPIRNIFIIIWLNIRANLGI